MPYPQVLFRNDLAGRGEVRVGGAISVEAAWRDLDEMEEVAVEGLEGMSEPNAGLESSILADEMNGGSWDGGVEHVRVGESMAPRVLFVHLCTHASVREKGEAWSCFGGGWSCAEGGAQAGSNEDSEEGSRRAAQGQGRHCREKRRGEATGEQEKIETLRRCDVSSDEMNLLDA